MSLDIDRANPNVGSAAIDMINAPSMSLTDLTIVGAGIGVRARSGSTNLRGHELDTYRIMARMACRSNPPRTMPRWITLTVFDNGRHGIFVDSRLN